MGRTASLREQCKFFVIILIAFGSSVGFLKSLVQGKTSCNMCMLYLLNSCIDRFNMEIVNY
jgi:hypothetical protein